MSRISRRYLKGFDAARLRLVLGALFLALALPTAVLVYRSYDQLSREAFHQHRVLAEELAARVNARFGALLAAEEARDYAQYSFFTLAGDPKAHFLQRSPLSQFPPDAALPGLIGYFQVDANGTLSTPLLPPSNVDPTSYGISRAELEARHAVRDEIEQVLRAHRLVRGGGKEADAAEPVAAAESQSAYAQDDTEEVLGKGTIREPIAAGSELATPTQRAFDRLDEDYAQKRARPDSKALLGRVEDLKLEERYRSPLEDEVGGLRAPRQQAPAAPRAKRREQTTLPEPAPRTSGDAGTQSIGGDASTFEASAESPPSALVEPVVVTAGRAGAPVVQANAANATPLIVNTFESEVDPFRLSVLDDGHLVLHRRVWRDGQPITQGALLERAPFFDALIEAPFRATALSSMSDLIVALHGEVVRVLRAAADGEASEYLGSAGDLAGALLYQTRLGDPLSAIELIFTVTRLPAGPGGTVVVWLSVVLGLVLVGGFAALYRLGLGQIELNRQQQDFVAAVSHELKTPLTSIRMYGEMLQAGWADEAKKQEYYDFICAESERLSRLIGNVLKLAQLTRNDPQFDLKPIPVAQLLNLTESKIATQVAQAGFELEVNAEQSISAAPVVADADCFAQVMINLVDNAIKFSRNAERRRIEIGAHAESGDRVRFTVRDYGPGVADDQMKKIFTLFYRTESELTRETVGTGIGLALVHQLVLAMQGSVDVRNRDPGAEFSVTLRRAPGV